MARCRRLGTPQHTSYGTQGQEHTPPYHKCFHRAAPHTIVVLPLLPQTDCKGDGASRTSSTPLIRIGRDVVPLQCRHDRSACARDLTPPRPLVRAIFSGGFFLCRLSTCALTPDMGSIAPLIHERLGIGHDNACPSLCDATMMPSRPVVSLSAYRSPASEPWLPRQVTKSGRTKPCRGGGSGWGASTIYVNVPLELLGYVRHTVIADFRGAKSTHILHGQSPRFSKTMDSLCEVLCRSRGLIAPP
jgi:hypothetical protein